jgi:hypothetical protein
MLQSAGCCLLPSALFEETERSQAIRSWATGHLGAGGLGISWLHGDDGPGPGGRAGNAEGRINVP